MARADIKDPVTGEVVMSYYIDERMKRNLDEKVVKQLEKRDKDCVIIVDGAEGSGKSTCAFQLGKYVDPTLDLSRVVFGPEEFRNAVLKAKKGQCIVYDEAFTGFSSRASLSPVNKVLNELMMQMRQKNLFILIVLPTIFMLDKYVAIFRTKALIHVFESKGVRGYFKLYNSRKKKYLILKGKKDMSYYHKKLYVKFKGRFYGKFALGDETVEELYRKKKEKALNDSGKSSMTATQIKSMEQRNILLYLTKKNLGLTFRAMSEYLTEYGIEISYPQLMQICAKFGDYGTSEEKKALETENAPVPTIKLPVRARS